MVEKEEVFRKIFKDYGEVTFLFLIILGSSLGQYKGREKWQLGAVKDLVGIMFGFYLARKMKFYARNKKVIFFLSASILKRRFCRL